MADVEDAVKNSGAAGRGSSPAEKGPAAGEAASAAAEEFVEMPEDYLRWLLAQTRDTDPVPSISDYSTKEPEELKRLQEQIDWLQASQDEFFEFQASVRQKLEEDGRVMIPAAAVGLTADQFQEAIDEFWYGLLKEYDDADSDIAVPSN